MVDVSTFRESRNSSTGHYIDHQRNIRLGLFLCNQGLMFSTMGMVVEGCCIGLEVCLHGGERLANEGREGVLTLSSRGMVVDWVGGVRPWWGGTWG
jgi:hypothetical protein